MTDIISVASADFGGEEVQWVRADSLFAFLGLTRNYKRWLKTNITDNKFAIEWVDYITVALDVLSSGVGHILTVDFAKRLSMMTRSEKGEEARQYFLNIEKAFKQVIKPKTTLEMLKEAVLEIETKEKQVLLLEKTVSKQNETNAQLFEMTAMATKTGIKTLKEDLGAEINTIVRSLYGDQFPWDYKAPHLHARKLYEEKTWIIYWWAKVTSMQGKRDYLRWLQKQRGGENILQDNF